MFSYYSFDVCRFCSDVLSLIPDTGRVSCCFSFCSKSEDLEVSQFYFSFKRTCVFSFSYVFHCVPLSSFIGFASLLFPTFCFSFLLLILCPFLRQEHTRLVGTFPLVQCHPGSPPGPLGEWTCCLTAVFFRQCSGLQLLCLLFLLRALLHSF